MINIANRHPKLHLFQVVTDFVKTDVGMSISFNHNYYKCKKQLKLKKEVGMVVQKVCIQECELG